ncbi:membrane protein containing DUF560 [Candidatus Magnetomorum sp. HK-1]|nr:membrane protein containing DUF560 [Candidatus Magnetomorum sp. HK-1]
MKKTWRIFVLLTFTVIVLNCQLQAEIIMGTDTGLAKDETATGYIPLGFTFEYWGQSYTRCSISENGWISLKYTASGASSNSAYTLPHTKVEEYMDAMHLDGFIAPLFDDLKIIPKEESTDQVNAKIYYYLLDNSPGSRQFIVQYNDMFFWNTDKPAGTFQAIFYEISNIIKFQYRYLSDATAIIALDNPNNATYVQCLQSNITAPQAISFSPVSTGPDSYTYILNESASYQWFDISGLTQMPPEDQGQFTNSDIVFSWNAEADAEKYTGIIVYKLDIAEGEATEISIVQTYTALQGSSLSYSHNLQEDQIYFARIAISLNNGDTYQNMSTFSDGIIYDTQPPDVYIPTAQSGQDNEVIFTFNGHDAYTISSYHIQIDIDPSFLNPIVDTSQNTFSESTAITYSYMATSGLTLYARASAIDGANNQSLYSEVSEPFLIPLISQVIPYTSTIVGQTTVVISGSNFGDTQGAVLFGTSEVTQISSWSMDSIVVKSPPRNPGVVDITILTDNGQKEIQTAAHEYFPMLNWTTSAQEFDENANNVTITATLDQLTEKDVLFAYTISGSATTDDYSLAQGQMIIFAGNMSVSKTFQLVDDSTTEPDETLVLQIINPVNAIAGSTSRQTITIKDNDAIIHAIPENISISAASGTTSFSVSNAGSGNLNWSAISNHSWLTIIQGATGTNDGIIQAQYDANTGEARTGSISIISAQATNSPMLLYINQEKPDAKKPTISSLSDMITHEDQPAGPFTFIVSDTAYTSSLLSVSVNSSNTSLLANEDIMVSGVSDNRNITVSPKPNEYGTAIIQLIVKNPEDLTASTSFMLTVTAINDPPIISNIDDLTIDEDATATHISYTISDIESIALTVVVFSSNQTLIPDDQLSIQGSGTNRDLIITPLENQYGQSSIQLIVSDTEGLTASQSFHLIVNPSNDTPVIADIPDQNINEDESFATISLNAFIDDVDNDDSEIFWITSGSQDLSVTINNRIALISTPNENWNGAETITFIASDPDGLTASDSAVFNVNPVNDPPVLSVISVQRTDEDSEFENIPLTLYVTDVDDTEFTWSTNGQNNLSISIENDIASITINTQNWYGTENILFTVTDPGGLTSNRMVEFNVDPVNDPPIISNIDDLTIDEDATATHISYTISDIESTALTVVVFSSNQTLIPDDQLSIQGSGTNRELIITPLENQSGQSSIQLIVSDTEGLTASQSFHLIVNPINDTPVIADIPDQNINEGESFATISLDAFIEDVDNAEDEISWLFTGNQNLAVLISNHIASISTPNEYWNGTETITFIASDPDGLTASYSAAYTVQSVNDPPTISDIDDQLITEYAVSHVIEFTVNDIESTDLSVLVYSTDQNVIPDSRLTIEGTGENRDLVIDPIANQTGQTRIHLIVSDSEGLTAQTEFLLAISNSSNISPDTPTIVSDVIHIDNNSDTTLLRANPFHDSDDNEQPIQTICRIGRMDRPGEYVIEEAYAYDDLLNNGYQEYPLNVSQLTPGLKYYWQIAFHHTGGQTEWSLRHPFLEGDIQPVNNLEIPVGDTQKQFKMISFTHFFPDPTGSVVLQNVLSTGYDTTNYRIGTYDPGYESGRYREYDDDLFTIVPGRAYWFLSRDPVDLNIHGVPVSKDTDIDIQLLYNPNSSDSWNMIACPNDADYYWGDLQVLYYENEQLVFAPIPLFDAKNQFIEKSIWQWHNGEYDQKTNSSFILERNKGYWINCLSSGVYLRFPKDKAIKKRSIKTTTIDWIQSKTLLQQAHAENSHKPPPPMNAFGRIQVDPEVSNCFIKTLNSQSNVLISGFLFLFLVFIVACHRHIKSVGIFLIAFLCLYASNGLSSESPLQIEAGRAFFDMGIFAFEDGMYEAAKDNFTKALAKNPHNPFYLQYAGKTYLKLEKYINAQKMLDRAWSINSKIHGLKFDRAYFYFKIKVYQKAIPLFVEIVDDSPENVLAVYLAGVSYFKNEQYVKAVQYLIQAAERSPNIKPNAFFYAGIARIKSGQIKNGLKLLKYVQASGDDQTKKLASQWITAIEKVKHVQKSFTANLSLGYLYDTNVQIEPDDMNLYSDEKDYASIFYAQFKYTTKVNDQWHLSMGHRLFLVKYQSLDDYDLMHMSPFLATQYRRYPFTLEFYYKACTDMFNNASYLTKHRFNPIIKQRIWDDIDFILSYEYTTEEYDIFPVKDGHRNDLTMKVKYPLNKTIILSSGMTYQDKNASHASSYFNLIQGEMELSFAPLMGLTLELTGKYYRKTYDHSDPAYGAKRIDRHLNTEFSILKQISPNIKIASKLEINYNDSNVNMFDYHRQLLMLMMIAEF